MILNTWRPFGTTHPSLIPKSLKKGFNNAFKPKSKQIRLTSMQLSFLHWKGPFRPANCCSRVEIYLCLLSRSYAKHLGFPLISEANLRVRLRDSLTMILKMLWPRQTYTSSEPNAKKIKRCTWRPFKERKQSPTKRNASQFYNK